MIWTSEGEIKKFGAVMAFVLAGLLGIILPFLKGEPIHVSLIGVGLAFAVSALVAPRFLEWPYYLWMRLGAVLGWVNSRILLSIVFFLLFSPMGLILRLMGRDPLKRKLDKLDKGGLSYRVFVDGRDIGKEMENPF